MKLKPTNVKMKLSGSRDSRDNSRTTHASCEMLMGAPPNKLFQSYFSQKVAALEWLQLRERPRYVGKTAELTMELFSFAFEPV